jgi:hypothetical protein
LIFDAEQPDLPMTARPLSITFMSDHALSGDS